MLTFWSGFRVEDHTFRAVLGSNLTEMELRVEGLS